MNPQYYVYCYPDLFVGARGVMARTQRGAIAHDRRLVRRLRTLRRRIYGSVALP